MSSRSQELRVSRKHINPADSTRGLFSFTTPDLPGKQGSWFLWVYLFAKGNTQASCFHSELVYLSVEGAPGNVLVLGVSLFPNAILSKNESIANNLIVQLL